MNLVDHLPPENPYYQEIDGIAPERFRIERCIDMDDPNASPDYGYGEMYRAQNEPNKSTVAGLVTTLSADKELMQMEPRSQHRVE